MLINHILFLHLSVKNTITSTPLISADTCETSRHDISTDWLKIKLFNVGIFFFNNVQVLKGYFIFNYGLFPHDVTEAILVFHKNDTAAILVYQTNPIEVELFSYINT